MIALFSPLFPISRMLFKMKVFLNVRLISFLQATVVCLRKRVSCVYLLRGLFHSALFFFILHLGSIVVARDLPPLSTYDIHQPPQGIFVDEWMEIFLMGKKIGYSHTSYRREGDSIKTRCDSILRMLRGTDQVTIETTQSTTETLDGEPIDVENKTLMGTIPLHTRSVVNRDTLTVYTRQGEYETTQTYPFSKDTRLLWGMTLLGMKHGLAPGTCYSIPFYSPDISPNEPAMAKIQVFDKELIDYYGTKVECVRAVMELEVGGTTLAITSWLDTDSRTLKTVFSNGSFPLETFLTTELYAKSEYEKPEIFNASLIPITKGIKESAKKVVFEIKLRDGSFAKNIPQTDFQTVEIIDEQMLRVTVKRANHDKLREKIHAYKELPEWAEYLQSNITLNLEDIRLRALLEKSGALSHERTSRRAAKLREFVSDYIKNNGLNVGFATSSEVCEKPEGDCTEHAVLLAALGRLAGIPSRVVSGLVYVPNYNAMDHVMGYHLWTQFYMDGKWVDFDSALKQSECQPTRIALAVSSLKDGASNDITFSLWKLIGKIEISIRSID